MSNIRGKISNPACHLENGTILSFSGEEDDMTPAGNQFARGIHQADVKGSSNGVLVIKRRYMEETEMRK